MALANVLVSGSYSVVDSVIYTKQNKTVSFNFNIYSDGEKQHLISSLQFSANGNNIVPTIESFELTSPPINPEQGKFWIVPADATGDWSGLVGKTVLPKNGGGWDHQENEGNIVYVVDKNAYYKCGQPMQEVSFVSSREFEEFFNTATVLEDGILKCCYEFVKNQLQLVNAVEV